MGRYALEIPVEAELVWGPAHFPATIDVLHGGVAAANKRLARDIEDIKIKDKTAEIVSNKPGPVKGSWQIRFYEDEFAKEPPSLLSTRTYINRGDVTFITGWYGRDTDLSVLEQQAYLASSLILRSADQTPREPGFCIEEAFIPDNRYADQEMVSAGIFIPSLPDINFSISSNKDAYADYDNFDAYRPKLSLLNRIKSAQDAQGPFYPSRTVLREGKRDVQHWHGEESLIKRKDGTHDFEWAFVGTPKDVANPSEYSAHMYSKVAHNTVGAASQASLTDDEAVALWDRLLSGLKFRVQVPGAPEGSYYAQPSSPMSPPPAPKPVVWYRDQPCPKDGYYKLVVDDPAYPYQAYLQKQPPSAERAGSMFSELLVTEPAFYHKARMVWVAELDDNGRKYSSVNRF
ncbi:T6SS immunity protein Tli4 family protein [Rhodoferax koreense]|uniref:T6SS immunity protein Tli4 family protein n=1 Tax=Rhodoferax koreensis TaxID=1842727 RepID=UPI001EF614B8|nr:T6SS immunity protein Tli4 family protein [Rhodoferax koreense]